MANTIIIEVSGGTVQAVYTDQDVKVVLVDWDNIEHGDKAGVFPHDPLASMPDETKQAVVEGDT